MACLAMRCGPVLPRSCCIVDLPVTAHCSGLERRGGGPFPSCLGHAELHRLFPWILLGSLPHHARILLCSAASCLCQAGLCRLLARILLGSLPHHARILLCSAASCLCQAGLCRLLARILLGSLPHHARILLCSAASCQCQAGLCRLLARILLGSLPLLARALLPREDPAAPVCLLCGSSCCFLCGSSCVAGPFTSCLPCLPGSPTRIHLCGLLHPCSDSCPGTHTHARMHAHAHRWRRAWPPWPRCRPCSGMRMLQRPC